MTTTVLEFWYSGRTSIPERYEVWPGVYAAFSLIERRKEVPLGQGLWQKPFPIDFSRSIFDVDICESFTEIIQANSDHPWVIGTRLKISDGRIAEIESLASDKRDWLFDAKNYLKYSSAEQWDVLPPVKRMDREALIKVADDYFDIFQDYSAFTKLPWGIPCVRIEGGYVYQRG